MDDILDGNYLLSDGKEHHVVVSSPLGNGGGGYHVYIDNYYKGQIVNTMDGWLPYINTPLLSADEIDVIMDLVRLQC